MADDPQIPVPAAPTDPAAAGVVAPAPITTGYLTSGSAHPIVVVLGRALAALGFPNSASRGENAYGTVDATILAAVHAFRSKHGVVEPPVGIFGGDTPAGATTAGNHIGPVTMNAIRAEAAKLATAVA